MNESLKAVTSVTVWLPLLCEALASQGRFRLPLRGTSMRPTLPDACEIEIVPQPPRLALGSLIVFAHGDALIAHRLVRRAAAGWITHGDGRLAPDLPLQQKHILGIVRAAYLDDQLIWPRRTEKLTRWFWVGRHHALRPVRAAWRILRALLRNK